jgi:PPOX class probable F420-dependent enzyme
VTVIPDGDFGERAARRLRDEKVIWLTTVGNDGTPQPNPVWFLWDGEDELLVYNRRDAKRLAHVAARPEVALHLDGDGRGGNIVVLAGTARIDADLPAAHENPKYVGKYGDDMARVSGTEAEFGAADPVAVRIAVRRVRGH